MKFLRSLGVVVCLLAVAGVGPFSAHAASRPNVLLICVDDLRPELNCYGVDYIQSPNIDRLASTGRLFMEHYVQAPTCGASRYTLLTGRYGPSSNGALFSRAGKINKDPKSVPPSMPAWFRKNGYTTVSVGKVSHHPGGRGGKDWDDDSKPETLATPTRLYAGSGQRRDSKERQKHGRFSGSGGAGSDLPRRNCGRRGA